MAWCQLAQLLAFLNVQDALLVALQTLFGNFNDRIDYVAQLPEAVWRQGVTAARIIVTPAAGVAPAVTRALLLVEAGQAGMIWRVDSRIFWVRAGRPWDD